MAAKYVWHVVYRALYRALDTQVENATRPADWSSDRDEYIVAGPLVTDAVEAIRQHVRVGVRFECEESYWMAECYDVHVFAVERRLRVANLGEVTP